VANVTRPGSRVLVVSGGKFGDRWREISEALGCRTDALRFAAGEAIDIGAVAERVERDEPEFLALTHVESSTGLLLPLRELIDALPRPRPVLIVDAIASLGVEEFAMDAWGIDVAVAACQKAFAAPAGLSFVSMGERARILMERCTRELYYFSLKRYEAGRTSGNTPFTPAIEIIQLVHNALGTIRDMGWETMQQRHRTASRAFLEAARHLSLESLPKSPSAAVQALVLPQPCRGKGFVETLAARTGIIVAEGQGELRGRIVRTGFLGLHSGKAILFVIKELGSLLLDMGCSVDPDAAGRALEELSDQAEIVW
jgi:aspartate aminotransferase-like enzyme